MTGRSADPTVGIVGTMFRRPDLAHEAMKLRTEGRSYRQIAEECGYPNSAEAKRAVWGLIAANDRPDDERRAEKLLDDPRDDAIFWRGVREGWYTIPWRPDWVWRGIFARENSHQMMQGHERNLLNAQPAIIRVYRGVLRQTENSPDLSFLWRRTDDADLAFTWNPYMDDDDPDLGFSWSLNPAVAELYAADVGVVTEGLVYRDKVVALFDNIDCELIALPEDVIEKRQRDSRRGALDGDQA